MDRGILFYVFKMFAFTIVGLDQCVISFLYAYTVAYMLYHCRNGQVDTVQLLIKKEAKVTAAEKCGAGNTALHYAAENSGGLSNLQAMELAKYFLNAGATIDARNKEQHTPLHLAVNAHTGAADSSVEMVIFLLDKGADPYAKSVRNRMPIHLAFKKIHKYVLALIC